MKKIKKFDIALIVGMIITLVFASVKTFAQDVDNISSKVVRLHILANSDTEEDQNLKLKVRDNVLSGVNQLFSDSNSILVTEDIIVDNMDYIKNLAAETINTQGYDYGVKCELVNMYFDEKVYDNVTMPAGYYDALRITIGEAKGHNWWCVMYPQLCLGPCIDVSDFNEFSDEEVEILKNPEKYEVKFKCVSWYRWLKDKMHW